MIQIRSITGVLSCILLFGCGTEPNTREQRSTRSPGAEVGPNDLADSSANPSLYSSLHYAAISVHVVEIDGVAYQLKVLCASLRPDSLDLAFKITLANAEGSIFDITVSKDKFSSYWSEETLLNAGLVELKFNKRERGRFFFTTYMGVRDPSSVDKIDFTIECMESEECAILSWSVNGKQVMQGCWG